MDLRQRVGRDDVDGAVDAQARGIRIDQQGRQATGALGLFGPSDDDVEVGHAAVGDIGFRPFEQVVVALQHGTRLGSGHVRSAIGLGQRKGRYLAALAAGLHIGRHQAWIAFLPQRGAANALHAEDKIRQRRVVAQAFAHQADGAKVQRWRHAIGHRWRCIFQQAMLGQALQPVAAFGLQILRRLISQKRAVVADPAVEPGDNFVMLLVKKRRLGQFPLLLHAVASCASRRWAKSRSSLRLTFLPLGPMV